MKEQLSAKPFDVIVIESAKPFLSHKPTKNGFGYYVKHWDVSGYRWDGDCMCSKAPFRIQAPIQELEITLSRLTLEIDRILK